MKKSTTCVYSSLTLADKIQMLTEACYLFSDISLQIKPTRAVKWTMYGTVQWLSHQ